MFELNAVHISCVCDGTMGESGSPRGWVEFRDPESGTAYYVNQRTGETTLASGAVAVPVSDAVESRRVGWHPVLAVHCQEMLPLDWAGLSADERYDWEFGHALHTRDRLENCDVMCERITERFVPDDSRVRLYDFGKEIESLRCGSVTPSMVRGYFNERVRFVVVACSAWRDHARRWEAMACAVLKRYANVGDVDEALTGVRAMLFKSSKLNRLYMRAVLPAGIYLMIHPDRHVLDDFNVTRAPPCFVGKRFMDNIVEDVPPSSLATATHALRAIDPSSPDHLRAASQRFLSESCGLTKTKRIRYCAGPVRTSRTYYKRANYFSTPAPFLGKVTESEAFDCVSLKIVGWRPDGGDRRHAVIAGPFLDIGVVDAIWYFVGQLGLEHDLFVSERFNAHVRY